MRRAVERAASVDWWIHTIATSDKYTDSLVDIETRWSVRQLTDAHRVLDVYLEIEKAATPKASNGPKGFSK